MKLKFAKRMSYIKASEIREILKVTEREDVISFAGGLPAPELFPIDEINKMNQVVLQEAGAKALQYTTTEGYYPLREWIAKRMNERLGTSFDKDNILITHGSQQGLDLSGKVFLLDHCHNELKGKYSSVTQNFEKDTYEALKFELKHIEKYKRIFMVQSEAKEPYERYNGLQRFSKEYGFEHKYLNNVTGKKIKNGDLFILVNDRDLVDVLKQAKKQDLTPGQEFGIISYNDTPLKEILAGGITTLSTDFKLMGKTMASLIGKKNIETYENPWILNIRKSL